MDPGPDGEGAARSGAPVAGSCLEGEGADARQRKGSGCLPDDPSRRWTFATT